jgi:hypothetical protein
VWEGTDPQGDQRSRGPLQGLRLGQEGASRDEYAGGVEVERGGHIDLRVEQLKHQLGACAGLRGQGDRIGNAGGIDIRRIGHGEVDRLTEMPASTDWITLAEAAEILAAANIHFTPSTIGGWARAGRLQSIKLGGRRFVRRGEVRALVAAPRRVRIEDVQPVLFEDLGG